MRDWIHVEDHNTAVLQIIESGKIGETWLIGADGEYSNREVLDLILQMMGKPPTFFESVKDRAGHDLRYAIDAKRLRSELGWSPNYSEFEQGLGATIDWYRTNTDWWQPLVEGR